SSSVRLSSRTISETSNRLSVEFQDESNEYQQDSLSLVDADDSGLIGYEISSQSSALGIANFSQATRVLLRQLDKSTKGNLFIQFQTSFRALKIRPGDLIAVTYLKEGFSRTLFRVSKLSPAMNYQLVTVLAQIHDDAWYSDDPTTLLNAGRQPGTVVQVPRPLIGTVEHDDANGAFEYFDFEVEENVQAQSDGSATDTLTIHFSQPSRPSVNLPNLPLLSLAPQYSSTGGSLMGNTNYYYAITVVDSVGNEGPPSFTVPAFAPGVSATNQVTIQQLSLPRAAASFNVYRGTTPQELYRIASNVALASSYQDSGAKEQPIGPPDASFDHANFYYRYEYAGPFSTTASSASTISCSDMGATSLAYSGMVVRIIEGAGRGQERLIAANDPTTLTVSPNWSAVPDLTSVFVISEGSWRFGAVSATSRVRFEIPYQTGTAIQILGRSANVNNQEASADLCPVTRVLLGGGQKDIGVASAPSFTLSAPGGGVLSLSLIGFADLSNTSSVTSGTLQIWGVNELSAPSSLKLAVALDQMSTTLQLTSTSTLASGDVIQIGSELLTILSAGDVCEHLPGRAVGGGVHPQRTRSGRSGFAAHKKYHCGPVCFRVL
ncbi:MAG: phage tail protein, partial [Acidobacteriota bacterium]|nr:phage tail protein [Acidobacteriota bacterium]